jgi:hypothetical protein
MNRCKIWILKKCCWLTFINAPYARMIGVISGLAVCIKCFRSSVQCAGIRAVNLVTTLEEVHINRHEYAVLQPGCAHPAVQASVTDGVLGGAALRRGP